MSARGTDDCIAFSRGLGKMVAYWRKRRGLTQNELAQRASTWCTRLSAIERGRSANISCYLLCRLADALDIEPGDLLPSREKELAREDSNDDERMHNEHV